MAANYSITELNYQYNRQTGDLDTWKITVKLTKDISTKDFKPKVINLGVQATKRCCCHSPSPSFPWDFYGFPTEVLLNPKEVTQQQSWWIAPFLSIKAWVFFLFRKK